MDPHSGKIVINGAVSQFDRWLQALDAGFAPVDGRPFPELLDFSVRYAELIRFYDLQNQIDGNWVDFFISDPTMLAASIGATNLVAHEARYLNLKRRTAQTHSFDEKFSALHQLFGVMLDLARRINMWHDGISQSPSVASTRLLSHTLTGLLETSLKPAVQKLKAFDLGAAEPEALGKPIGQAYSAFGPNWNLAAVRGDSSIYQGRTNLKKIDQVLTQLNPIYYTFQDAISELQPLVQSDVEETLEDGNHKPQLALYIAFARLFQSAQETINTFSIRYRNFYYFDVLRQAFRPPVPDQLYLTFALADDENVTSGEVPHGTLFPAGQDINDREILYATDKNLLVTTAVLDQLLAVQKSFGPLYVADSTVNDATRPKRATHQVFSSIIRLATAIENQLSWPPFGSTQIETTPVVTTELATLGFGLASQSLLLGGGTRTIRIQIQYPLEFQTTVLNPQLEQIVAVTGATPTGIFETLLEGAFQLFLSTTDGWLPVKTYQAKCKFTTDSDPNFTLIISLPAEAPPIAPFSPEEPDPATANPHPELPTCKAYLVQTPVLIGSDTQVWVYPLSLLELLPILSLKIHVKVTDLTNLSLSNTDGAIDPTSPYAVFGGLPVVGSYLEIQHSELFCKNLSSLSVGIKWFNLPQNETGFMGYYKDYVIGLDGLPSPTPLFENQYFEGVFRVKNPGTWVLSDVSSCPETPSNSVEVFLFRTKPDCDTQEPTPDGQLCRKSEFTTLQICPAGPPDYYNPNQSALRLEFSEPPYGFGNAIYAQNVLNAVIEDLPDSEKCEEKCLAECQMLKAAAQLIEAGLLSLADCQMATCSDTPGCLEKSLTNTVTYICTLVITCLETCEKGSSADVEQLRQLLIQVKVEQKLLDTSQIQTLHETLNRFYTGNIQTRLKQPAKCFKCLSLVEVCLHLLADIIAYQLQAQANFDELKRCLRLCKSGLEKISVTCLEQCLAMPVSTDPKCIIECVQNCLNSLFQQSFQKLETCLGKISDPQAVQVLTQIKEKIQSLRENPSITQTQFFQECLGLITSILQQDPLPVPVKLCLEAFEKRIDACLCLENCVVDFAAQSKANFETLEKSLVDRQTEAETAFEECYELCVKNCMSLKNELKYPNEPYLPQAEKITVTYEASCYIPTTGQNSADGMFFQLLPFAGYQQPELISTLLPVFPNQGNLYLGFSGLPSSKLLTLLFQMVAENTGDQPVTLPQVRWNYLSENRWHKFKETELRQDTTNGLQNTGITGLVLPLFDPTGTTILPADYQWLWVSAKNRAPAFPTVIGIYPHAMLATWQNIDNTGETLKTPVPAYTITSSVQDLPDIGSIVQPMPSFGGRPPENDRTLTIRVGERLQHKDRAVLNWDYERLVLERFPTIWKVQALPARNPKTGNSPGEVLVVVIPGPDSDETMDPTTPTVSSAMLNQIQMYLASRNSPFINLQVVNPIYVLITVTTTVQFLETEDSGDCINRLNTDLINYLSPWFYDVDRAAKGGTYATEANISEFIQTRPYVEVMLSISLTHSPKPRTLDWYFLTSAKQHQISTNPE